MKILILIAILFGPPLFAASQEKHLFYCLTTEGKQVYLALPVDKEDEGIAEMIIAKSSASGWSRILEVEAKVDLRWGKFRNRAGATERAVTGAVIHLGRSGTVEMHATEALDEFGSAPGELTANLRQLNHPEGIAAEYCTYFHQIGNRPGLSGSNRPRQD